jgi:phosphate starvation-inducible PhoH-like protein
MQMKMFLTRIGEGSKMIITGDPTQIDLPDGSKSGLVHSLGLLNSVPEIKQIHFTDADVVRHPLVAKIVRAYEKAEEGEAGTPDARPEPGGRRDQAT